MLQTVLKLLQKVREVLVVKILHHYFQEKKSSYPALFGALGHATLFNNNSCVQNTCDGFHDGCYFDAQGGVEKITLFKLN